MTDHKASLKAVMDAVRTVETAATQIAAKIEETREILHRPDGPALLKNYHNGAVAAAQHLAVVDADLASVQTSVRVACKTLRTAAARAGWLRDALTSLYSGLQDEADAQDGGPLFEKRPLVDQVRENAGARAPEPAQPQGPKWTVLRVWNQETKEELQGLRRLLALEALRSGDGDGVAVLVPPDKIGDDLQVLTTAKTTYSPSGTSVDVSEAVLVGEEIQHWTFVEDFDWDGFQEVLDKAMGDAPPAAPAQEAPPPPAATDPDLAVACPLSGCEQPVGQGCATHADRRRAAEKARGGEKKGRGKKKGAA